MPASALERCFPSRRELLTLAGLSLLGLSLLGLLPLLSLRRKPAGIVSSLTFRLGKRCSGNAHYTHYCYDC